MISLCVLPARSNLSECILLIETLTAYLYCQIHALLIWEMSITIRMLQVRAYRTGMRS